MVRPRISHLVLAGLVTGAAVSVPGSTLAAPAAPPAARAAISARSLVFVLTTGLEDAQTLSSVFRHAQAAAAASQHRLREVVILVCGRGIQAFDGRIQSRPSGLVEMITRAQRAGVRVILCAQAIDRMGLDRERLDPAPTEIVPNAIATLVDYVANDAAVVSY